MSKYMLSAFAAVALLLSSCSNPSQPTSPEQRNVSSNKATSQWHEIPEWWVWNPCCQDYIIVGGRWHSLSKPDGTFKVNSANITATDASGNTYHGTMNYTSESNADGTYSYVQHYTFNSPTGCSFTIKLAYHYEIDENGFWVFVLDKEEIICN